MKTITTPKGVRLGLEGEKPSRPAPVLFNFMGALTEMTHPPYGAVGRHLAERGALVVSLDLPCHGEDPQANEPVGLLGWAFRVKQGRDIVTEFQARASSALDYLIAENYVDPCRIFAAGTSRGGFQAIHWATKELRIKAVAAFSPVTDLLALNEFKGLEESKLARRLALFNPEPVRALAGRPVWLTIGNNDQRVGTDLCIKLARKITQSAVEHQLKASVELHVMESEGHAIPAMAHQEAAEWFLTRI